MAELVRCVLVNNKHKLPMPDRNFALFPKGARGRVVNIEDPFYARCLADNSIRRKNESAEPSTVEESGSVTKASDSEGDN